MTGAASFADRRRLLQLETLYDLALKLHAERQEQELVDELLERVCAVLDPAVAVAVTREAAAGSRPESTIALTAAAVHPVAGSRHDLLGPEWLARWGRSQARFPSDVAAGEQPALAQKILGHLQFR